MAESTLIPQQSGFDRIMGFIPLIGIILLFLQGWGDLAILGFNIGIFGFVAWFWTYSIQKPLTTLHTNQLVLQPLGNDTKLLRIGVIFCCIEILFSFLLGADSLLRYQVMDNYGIFYIILIVTCYNFFWFWIPFTIWQDMKIAIQQNNSSQNQDQQIPTVQKILSRISKRSVNELIKRSLGIFLILELCFLVDSLFWFYLQVGLVEFSLSTPGSLVHNGPLIDVSAFIYLILFCQPSFLILLLQKAHQEIISQIKSITEAKSETPIKSISEKERLENLKITRTLYFFTQDTEEI